MKTEEHSPGIKVSMNRAQNSRQIKKIGCNLERKRNTYTDMGRDELKKKEEDETDRNENGQNLRQLFLKMSFKLNQLIYFD